MNFGKFASLKGLVSHSSGKRRFKGDLTPDMISPPIGWAFRHTMHVGRGGDVFGDTSFLSNHGGAGNNTDGDSSSTSEKEWGILLPHAFAMSVRPPTGPTVAPRTFRLNLLPFLRSLRMPFPCPGWTWTHPTGCPVKVLFPSPPKHQRTPHACMVSPVVFTFVRFRFKCRSEVMGVLCVYRSHSRRQGWWKILQYITTVRYLCFERSWKWMKSLQSLQKSWMFPWWPSFCKKNL